jgi:hypothetical protein
MGTDQRRGRRGRMWMVVFFVAVVLPLALLVTSQIGKWTCAPPDGVWVEASDRCIDLP